MGPAAVGVYRRNFPDEDPGLWHGNRCCEYLVVELYVRILIIAQALTNSFIHLDAVSKIAPISIASIGWKTWTVRGPYLDPWVTLFYIMARAQISQENSSVC